jgi:metallo-beta-lactamase class B
MEVALPKVKQPEASRPSGPRGALGKMGLMKAILAAALGVIFSHLGCPTFGADTGISMRRLTGPIYLVEDDHYDRTNSLVYVGLSSVTVVGATWTPETARLLDEQVKRVTDRPISEVIDTSPDPEWSGGNAYWKRLGVKIVAVHVTTEQLEKHWASTVAAARKNHPTYPDLPLVLPTETYSDQFVLQDGAVRAFYLGQSHTEADIFVYFPREQVLDAGSILKEQLGNMANANTEQYSKTLHKLQELHLNIRTIISGHWSAVHGPELVDRYLDLLELNAQQGSRR